MGLLDNFIITDENNTMGGKDHAGATRGGAGSNTIDTPSLENRGRRTQNSKLTSGSFIPQEALNKLNLKNPNNKSAATSSQSANLFKSNIINKKVAPSPQSFQSDDFSDDIYNSEDSISSLGSTNHNFNYHSTASNAAPAASNNSPNICLIPKHQQKKYNQLNSSNDDDSIHNHNPNIISKHDDLTNLLHDDIDLTDSPDQHVDYLTHKWDEDEISKSWKYVTLRRCNVADSARLENASWRTWAQTRLGLKTISPEELNWSKDSDVTWLYGPVIKSSTTNNNTNNNNNTTTTNNSNSNVDLVRNHSMDNESSVLFNSDKFNENTNLNDQGILNISENTKTNNSLLNKNLDHKNNDNDKNNNNSSSTPTSSTPSDQIKSQNSDHLKSILKKKSNVEKMISGASYSRLQHLLENREQKLRTQSSNSDSSPILEPSSPRQANPSTLNPSVNTSSSNYTLTSNIKSLDLNHNRSSNSLLTLNPNSSMKSSLPSQIRSSLKNSSLHIQQNALTHSNNSNLSIEKKEKHIHFNMRVDQCISLDDPSIVYKDRRSIINHSSDDNPSDENDDDHYADDECDNYDGNGISKELKNNTYDYSDSDSDSDSASDEGFVLNPTVFPNISHKPHEKHNIDNSNIKMKHSSSNSSGTFSGSSLNEIKTIAPLPATTLNFGSDDEYENGNSNSYSMENDSNAGSKMYTTSHNTKTNRGYDYYYDYNTVYSNTSNPLIYLNSNNEVNSDVQMFDVPADCQLEDASNNNNSITDSKPNDTIGSSSNTESPLNQTYSLSNISGNNSKSGNSNVVDIPISFMNDIPNFSDPANVNDNENNIQHIETANFNSLSNSDEGDDSGGDDTYDDFITLKRNKSMGSSNSRNASTQSLSSIKIGLSGLDLSTTGLRRSTGAGSKPQLCELANFNQSGSVSTFEAPLKPSVTSHSRNKFLFADSDSEAESESGDDSDALMLDNDDNDGTTNHSAGNEELYRHPFSDHDGDSEMHDDSLDIRRSNQNLVNAVRSVNSISSLADINKQFGSMGNLKFGQANNSTSRKKSTFLFNQSDSDSD